MDVHLMIAPADAYLSYPEFPEFVEQEISGGAVAPEAILVEDVDGGNGLDVIAASSVDDTISWYENDGLAQPSFTPHLLTDDAPGVQDMFWADLGGSTLPDLVVALAGVDSISWYENMGGPDFDFGPRQTISALNADGASSVFAADLDGDTDMDVLSTSANDNKVSWYENLGPAGFGTQTNLTQNALGAQAVFVEDIDGDTDLDVVAVSRDDDTVRWFESDLFGGAAPPGFTEHLVEDFSATRALEASFGHVQNSTNGRSLASRATCSSKRSSETRMAPGMVYG